MLLTIIGRENFYKHKMVYLIGFSGRTGAYQPQAVHDFIWYFLIRYFNVSLVNPRSLAAFVWLLLVF